MHDIRSFLDDDGMQWEVREICDPTLAIVPTRHLRRPEFAQGWLLFTTHDGQRRRLAPYPRDWHASSDGELLSLCRHALVAGMLPSPPGAGPSSARELQG